MVEMNYFEKLEAGLCPNDCGKLMIPKCPINVALLCPIDVLDAYYSSTVYDDNFDNIAITALCPICSFVITQNVKSDHKLGGGGMIYMDNEPIDDGDSG